MRSRIGRFLHDAFVVVVFILMAGAVIGPLRFDESANLVDGDPFTQGLWIIIYCITIFLALRDAKRIYSALRGTPFVAGMLLLAVLSFAWSGEIALTVRRTIAILGTSMFGLYVVSSYDWRAIVRLLLTAFFLEAAFSIVFALFLPQYGLHPDPRFDITPWRGAFIHRNTLGGKMALAAALWLVDLLDRKRSWSLLGFCLSVGLVFLSKSATAEVATVVLSGVAVLVWGARVRRGFLALIMGLFLLTGAGVAGWAVANLTLVTDWLGRDASLSGRTEIWAAVWEMVKQRPWFGYGYSAFWLGWAGPSRNVWLAVLNYVRPLPPTAHNGYLDVWLQLGVGGLLLFLVSLTQNIVFAVRKIWRGSESMYGLFTLVFLLFTIQYNFFESAILVQNSFYWVMYVVVSAHLGMQSHARGPHLAATATGGAA